MKKIFFGMSDLKKYDDEAILTTRCIQKVEGPSLNEMGWMEKKQDLQLPWDLLQNSSLLLCRYLPWFTPPPSS